MRPVMNEECATRMFIPWRESKLKYVHVPWRVETTPAIHINAQPRAPKSHSLLFTQKHNTGPKKDEHRQSRRERQQRQSEVSAGSQEGDAMTQHKPSPGTSGMPMPGPDAQRTDPPV